MGIAVDTDQESVTSRHGVLRESGCRNDRCGAQGDLVRCGCPRWAGSDSGSARRRRVVPRAAPSPASGTVNARIAPRWSRCASRRPSPVRGSRFTRAPAELLEFRSWQRTCVLVRLILRQRVSGNLVRADLLAEETESSPGRPAVGAERAVDEMLPHVYKELRALASRQLRNERSWHTLNTTALVNEAYLRLCKRDVDGFQDKRHFLAAASVAMRRILVDYARQRGSRKRGGDFRRIEWDESRLSVEQSAEQVLAINEALEWLSTFDPRLARIVELRFFGGLTFGEAAEATGMALRTLKRDWKKARALLLARLTKSPKDDDG
ncbi:MAG: sigma-70 family RNA polymerase sigma factor [bacterium]|nr:sigma-70 family RNA polymerase sigma factor [bacterium]